MHDLRLTHLGATIWLHRVYVLESMSSRTRLFFFVLVGSIMACGWASSNAVAESSLAALGPGKIVELSHKLDIRLGTDVYEVEETLVFANQSKGSDAEALYTFELPAQAAIVDLSVRTDGQRSNFAIVGAKAATRLVEDPSANHSADMGLVRMTATEGSADSDRTQYELRVFPIPADRTTAVVLKWHGTVRLVAGNYSIRLPDRGQAPKLARTEIVIATNTAMSQLYGGETLLGAKSRPGQTHRFFAPATGDLVIQGRTKNRASGPRAEVALFPLSPSSGIAALRVLLPDASRAPMPTIDRAVLIVDTSSSVTRAGTEAAAKLLDGLFGELGGNTRIETILYERESRAVLGGFRGSTRDARSRVLQSVRTASGGNGSDLGAALAQARKLLDADASSDMRKTLIVILSDGMIPTTLTGDRAADLLGDDILGKATLLTAVLVPPNAPLPDVHQSALGDMMQRGHGRIVALRHADAKAASASLLSELSQPLALGTLEVELSSGDWVGANLEGQLQPGSSITALGFYQGKAPKTVTVRGLRGGVPETLVATKLRGSQARALAAITVANASPFGMPGIDVSAEQSQESLRHAAAELGVVTQVSAGIAVAATDGYAADRIRLAQKWGMQTYLRVAPPAERDALKKSFASFRLRPRRRAVKRGRTGYIDEKMIARRVKAHVIPVARRCYEKLLRTNHAAAGALSLHIEMARGEVLHANIPFLPPSLEPIRKCIEDAMYAMPVPIVRQGQAAELVSVANYPLRFRMAKKGSKGAVEPTSPDDPDATDNPLLGLPD